jgi:hypothetical protein
MDTIELNLKYSRQQIIKAYEFHYRSILHPKRDLTIALILLIAGLYFQGTEKFNYLWVSVIIISILFFGLQFFAFFIVPPIVYKRDEKLRENYFLKFTDEAILFKIKGVESEIKWNFYNKFQENDEFILLYYGKNSFTILPKNEFNSKDDLSAFLKTLKEKYPNNK